MRALFSKQEEPLLYRSTGNYFLHVSRSNLPTPEKRPKVHFALFLKTKIGTLSIKDGECRERSIDGKRGNLGPEFMT